MKKSPLIRLKSAFLMITLFLVLVPGRWLEERAGWVAPGCATPRFAASPSQMDFTLLWGRDWHLLGGQIQTSTAKSPPHGEPQRRSPAPGTVLRPNLPRAAVGRRRCTCGGDGSFQTLIRMRAASLWEARGQLSPLRRVMGALQSGVLVAAPAGTLSSPRAQCSPGKKACVQVFKSFFFFPSELANRSVPGCHCSPCDFTN